MRRSLWRCVQEYLRNIWFLIKQSEISSEILEVFNQIGEEVWEDINTNPVKYFTGVVGFSKDSKIEREEKVKAWFKEVRVQVEHKIATDPEFDKIKNVSRIINIVYAITSSKKV